MNIAVIVPFPGKKKYQDEYDAIVEAVEHHGDVVLSPEKPMVYLKTIAQDTKLRDKPRAEGFELTERHR